MLESFGLLLLGLLLLALGGDSMVKGAAGLAQRIGASPFTAGLVVVAFGTSVPELAVNARALWVGQPALALGNAVGSNVANIGLTFALAALAAPFAVRWRALSPMLLALLAGTVLAIVLSLDGRLSRIDGLVLLAGFVVAMAACFARGRDPDPAVHEALAGHARTSTHGVQNLLRVAVAAGLLFFGAKYVVTGALPFADALGFEPLLAGLVIVAIGTALPEAAAAIAAARRGQGDIVAGHVIGASLFNLLVVLGGMAAWRGIEVPASFVRLEWPAALAFALMLLPVLRGDFRASRGEGALLLVAFGAWLWLELALSLP